MPTAVNGLVVRWVGLPAVAGLSAWWCTGNHWLAGLGAAAGYSSALLTRKRGKQLAAAAPGGAEPAESAAAEAELSVVDELLQQRRESLLLRPQVAESLSDEELERVWDAFSDRAAIVPEGPVALSFTSEAEETAAANPLATRQTYLMQVEAYWLDRYAVTNAEYRQFVADGGYRQMVLWDPHVWPAVLDFVDSTGQSGPRFFRDGQPLSGTEKLPVVGVSWYEASAYARWVGKRLPTDAEWVKAGAWPVASGGAVAQRRFPWGDEMDRCRCNLGGCGTNQLANVEAYPNGANISGIHQLIGNCWEWTTAAYGTAPGGSVDPVAPLRAIRGGAFDTYFDAQATCQFQSGDHPLARRHNIGFRCAVSACDLQPRGARRAAPTDLEVLELEEATP